MRRIPLTRAEPGMVLAEAVLFSSGMVLAGVGVELTAAIIDRMAASGIGSLAVEGDAHSDNAAEYRDLLEKLPFLFRRHTQEVFMMTLQTMLRRYFTRKATEAEQAAARRKAAKTAAGSGTPSADGKGGPPNG